MTRRGAFDATLRWNLLNLGSDAIIRKTGANHALRMRFEDFLANPREQVDMARILVDERAGRSPFIDDHTVQLGINHNIAGNPSRFITGAIRLEDKLEWLKGQSFADRLITTAVALPFMHRYGYPIQTRAGNAS